MRLLKIFVMPDCFGCERAVQVAEWVQSRNVPDVAVEVIDLSVPGSERPENVFAVPTYLLDETVISLGNPDEEWLLDRLVSSIPCRVGEQR